MAVNYNILGQLASPQIIAQLPAMTGGGDDFASLISGLAGVVGNFNKPSTNYQNPNTYGTAGAASALKQNQQVNPMQPIQPGGLNQSTLGRIGQNNGIFNNALKQLGINEKNPVLTQYLSKANPSLDPSVTPWCAGFVGSVLNASGLKGTHSLAAKSYLNYGSPTNTPQKGDIVVFNDLTGRNDPAHGHVGFVDHIENGKVYTLGGNQDNSVSIKAFPMNAVAGFRVAPTGQQVQQFAQQNNIQNPKQLSNVTKPVNNVSNNLQAAMAGIAHVESSGSDNPYGLVSKPSRNGDQAYGKYQIMGNNIPAWSKEALGRPITKQEFLNNPDIQDKIASFKINQYLKQTGNLDDTWSMWFSGRPVNKAGNARDAYGTTVPDYLKKAREGVSQFLENLQGSPITLNDTPTLPPLVPGQPSNQQHNRSQPVPSIPQSPIQSNPLAGFYQAPNQIVPDQQINPTQIATQGGGINWGLLTALAQRNQNV